MKQLTTTLAGFKTIMYFILLKLEGLTTAADADLELTLEDTPRHIEV